MARIKWLGDPGDPECLSNTWMEFTFPKGEDVEVPDGHQIIEKAKLNPHYEVDGAKPKAAAKADKDEAKAEKAMPKSAAAEKKSDWR